MSRLVLCGRRCDKQNVSRCVIRPQALSAESAANLNLEVSVAIVFDSVLVVVLPALGIVSLQ
jgi:hypothetical protein